MKRLVIMVIYSSDGQLEGYKKQLLNGIKPYADNLYVVCNCEMSEPSYIFLKQNADHVMIRKNIGFDAGAYKDVILETRIEDYDELLLMNDTFYGFFYSLDEFFDKTKERKDVDFWGLTTHTEGENDDVGSFEEHIQSYFLLIKSHMLHSKDFQKFWKEMPYPLKRADAIKNFEIRFSSYFKLNGFKGAAFCDLSTMGIECEYNLCPYWKYPLELIQLLRYPVLKVKPYSNFLQFYKIKNILDYIEQNLDYEVNLIYENLEKKFREDDDGPFNIVELENFYYTYKRIFIYGHGEAAKNISAYFEHKRWNFEGFIVSEKKDDNEKVTEYSEMKFEKTDGIILALGRRSLKEVYPKIRIDVSEEQLFLPKYKDMIFL